MDNNVITLAEVAHMDVTGECMASNAIQAKNVLYMTLKETYYYPIIFLKEDSFLDNRQR